MRLTAPAWIGYAKSRPLDVHREDIRRVEVQPNPEGLPGPVFTRHPEADRIPAVVRHRQVHPRPPPPHRLAGLQLPVRRRPDRDAPGLHTGRPRAVPSSFLHRRTVGAYPRRRHPMRVPPSMRSRRDPRSEGRANRAEGSDVRHTARRGNDRLAASARPSQQQDEAPGATVRAGSRTDRACSLGIHHSFGAPPSRCGCASKNSQILRVASMARVAGPSPSSSAKSGSSQGPGQTCPPSWI